MIELLTSHSKDSKRVLQTILCTYLRTEMKFTSSLKCTHYQNLERCVCVCKLSSSMVIHKLNVWVKKFPKMKAPGLDGFNAAFYPTGKKT